MVHQASELVHVRTATDTITATPNHPFWVQGRGWVEADTLAWGDTLVLADGGRADIVSLTREKLASPVDVYNLEVEGYHTYFVASSGVWVHNCGGETTTLYRAVNQAEANSVSSSGGYSSPVGQGKYFYPTAEQARNLATRYSSMGLGNHIVTSGEISSHLLQYGDAISPAGEGPAWWLPNSLLPHISNVQ